MRRRFAPTREDISTKAMSYAEKERAGRRWIMRKSLLAGQRIWLTSCGYTASLRAGPDAGAWPEQAGEMGQIVSRAVMEAAKPKI